jgi:hypothetical protein
MRFNPLIAAVAGLLAIAAIPALVHRADERARAPNETGQSHEVAKSGQPNVSQPNAPDNDAGTNLSAREEPSYSPSNAPDDSRTTNWIQALSGLAVAAFTYFLWRLQSRQVGLTENAVDEAGKSARAALASADHAARAAKAAVDQHRAWIKITELSIYDVKYKRATNRPGEPELIAVMVRAKLENVGATPATSVCFQPHIWAFPMIANYTDWPVMWDRALAEFKGRLHQQIEGGSVLFPNDPKPRVHGINTLWNPVEGSFAINSDDPTPIRLMGIAMVVYRIASGDEVHTSVPFLWDVKPKDYLTSKYLADASSIPDADVTLAKIEHAEQAT